MCFALIIQKTRRSSSRPCSTFDVFERFGMEPTCLFGMQRSPWSGLFKLQFSFNHIDSSAAPSTSANAPETHHPERAQRCTRAGVSDVWSFWTFGSSAGQVRTAAACLPGQNPAPHDSLRFRLDNDESLSTSGLRSLPSGPTTPLVRITLPYGRRSSVWTTA